MAELTKKEGKEIYELMGLLEGNAVKNSSYTSKQLNELQKINLEFIKAQNSIEMLDYDRLFHQKLIENYENESACKIIEDLRVRISLYDYAFWNDNQKDSSVEMHEKIIAFLISNDIKSAVKLVEHNWMTGVQFIINNLEKGDQN